MFRRDESIAEAVSKISAAKYKMTKFLKSIVEAQATPSEPVGPPPLLPVAGSGGGLSSAAAGGGGATPAALQAGGGGVGPPGDDDDGDGPSGWGLADRGRKDKKEKKEKRDKREPCPPPPPPPDSDPDSSVPSIPPSTPGSEDEPPRREERRGRSHATERPKTKEAEKVAVPDFSTMAQLPQWKMQLLRPQVARRTKRLRGGC